ncbi:ATP-grasp fold amidoligase family protein [Haloechinothrix sp. LS1_15]|uniref:ATP-grasp fold amidoligase family protein n=1 Tax=Haloechinothrix sp. LS1_15 TaxID=2652248 RepID=UPI0029487758|nr:ATP-grasp fold amidoligase family protein [Haloechinothrix sp. LS1_15]MDV6011072.1 hypothetical protein [Haloechinothrix sp. LS1_15]
MSALRSLRLRPARRLRDRLTQRRFRSGDELRLVRVEAQHYRFPAARASGATGENGEASHNFLVRVTARRGEHTFVGIGECQPRQGTTGDGDRAANTAWGVFQSLARRLHDRVLPATGREEALDAVRQAMTEFRELVASYTAPGHEGPPFRGTLFGIEVALLDVVAQSLQLRISDLLGGAREELEVSAAPLAPELEAGELARRVARQRRFPVTRLRASGELDADWRRLEVAAAANRDAGWDKPLWLDLDGAHAGETATRFVEGVATRMRSDALSSTVLLGGLLPAERVDELAHVQRLADDACRDAGMDLRILLDGAATTPDDLREACAQGTCRALSIQPARVGGVLAAWELAHAAITAGSDVHVVLDGVRGSSDVTVWALHNLARALPRLDYLAVAPPTAAKVRTTDPAATYAGRETSRIAPQQRTGLGAGSLPDAVEPHVERRFDSANDRRHSATGAVSAVWDDIDIDALRASKESVDRQIHDALKRTLYRKAMRQADAEYRAKIRELLALAEPRHMTHLMARELENNDLSLHSGLSFTALMFEQSEARRLGAFRPGWLLDNKTNAYAFVDELGVRRPASDLRTYRFTELEQASPIVIKPVKGTGSRGAYAVTAPDRIRHLYDGTELSSWEEMVEHANHLMSPKRTRKLADRWMVEELILEDSAAQRLATDVKFYACYGEIVLIRESRRLADGKQAVRFWTADGDEPDVGIDEEPLPEARGATQEQLAWIAAISREIPVPFMRIDMLRGEDGLVFGEFTPRPGGFEQLNSTWDRIFAEGWIRAEGRIVEDVLAGKDFSAFAKATGTSAGDG